jgi:Protein of unknown function (DUF507)
MSTQKETVRLLCKSIVTRLENNKSISFPPRLRQIVQDEVFGLVGPYILSDEDIKEKAIARMGAKAEALQDSGSSESDAFKAAKAVVKGQVGEHELNGFYFQKPMKEIATTIAAYFMRSSHIDDVYETDEDLEKQIVDVIKKFDASQLH